MLLGRLEKDGSRKVRRLRLSISPLSSSSSSSHFCSFPLITLCLSSMWGSFVQKSSLAYLHVSTRPVKQRCSAVTDQKPPPDSAPEFLYISHIACSTPLSVMFEAPCLSSDSSHFMFHATHIQRHAARHLHTV